MCRPRLAPGTADTGGASVRSGNPFQSARCEPVPVLTGTLWRGCGSGGVRVRRRIWGRLGTGVVQAPGPRCPRGRAGGGGVLAAAEVVAGSRAQVVAGVPGVTGASLVPGGAGCWAGSWGRG